MSANELRDEVIARDKVCRLCGSSDALTVHHIRPRRFGGVSKLHNVVLVCRPCHNDIEVPVQRFFSLCVSVFVWLRTILLLWMTARCKRSNPGV